MDHDFKGWVSWQPWTLRRWQDEAAMMGKGAKISMSFKEIWGFPFEWGTPIAGWFINVYNGTSHLEVHDLRLPLFQETTKYIQI